MQYSIVFIFIVVYVSFGNELGYTRNSPFYTHFTYMLQHASWLHLIINSFAFIGIYKSLRQFIGQWKIGLFSVVSAFAASFLAMYDVPTVGASAVVYAMLGGYISTTLFRRDIKIADTRKYRLFLLSVLFCMLFSLFRQSSNFMVHIWSFSFGFLFYILYSLKRNMNQNKNNDYQN